MKAIIIFLFIISGIFRNISSFAAFYPFEYDEYYDDDTINKTENHNLKQGYWIYFGGMTNLPGYQPEQKVEEGNYVKDKKHGLWLKFFPNGKVQSEITFLKGRPDGRYRFYFENGLLHEEGVWKNNRNTELFRRYYKNGRVRQEFNFNDSGIRNGWQKYFYENGQLRMVGKVRDGKETGEFREYYSDGNVKALRIFLKPGIVHIARSMRFEFIRSEIGIMDEEPEPDHNEKFSLTVSKDEKPNEAVSNFRGEGFHILYNKDLQISQKGFFEMGRLKSGLLFIYDENGILVTIERYEQFKFVGEGVL